MRISKITSIQNNKRIANKQVSVENKQNQKNINITNPSLLFQPYIGRDIVSFRAKNYSDTLKENYYQLPIGCSPDAFQIDAGKALNEGKTVLVEAPTGTGKTAIAYYVSTKNMSEGKKTFYTAPLKALSNQKLNEFKKIYGDENIGILTGDRRENTEAPIIIMTTEVYRNMALSNLYGEENPLMKNLGTVIFDEFHYLGDKDRGPVWEEAMMFTPKDVQTLELSATIGNPAELKNWISSLRGNSSVELVSIPSEARHVPLSFDMLTTKAYEKSEKRIAKAIRRGETPDTEDTLKVRKPKLNDFKAAVEKLNEEDKLPAIFFIFSKKYSREVLDHMARNGADLTSEAEKEEIEKIVNRYKQEKYIGTDLDIEALKKGYAIHNSGIIPDQKELIEELFQKKLLKAVIATETLAAGINMPAKTVVISSPYKPCDDNDDIKKLYAESLIKMEEEEEEDSNEEVQEKGKEDKKREQTPVRMLTANEFKQMAGRAGRRGIDTIGYVYTMPTDRASEQDFLYLEVTDCNAIKSNYNPDYGFLSGYYEHNTGDNNLLDVYGKTFYAYSKDANVKSSRIDELMTISDRKKQVLLERGYLTDTEGYIEPTKLSKMASRIKGYDTLLLTETVASKELKGISPEALAMFAGAIANPSKSDDTTIGYSTDLSPVFLKAQESVVDIEGRLKSEINSILRKFGKELDSFANYDDMLAFANKIEKPEISREEIAMEISRAEARRAKMYQIIKTTGSYSGEDLVKALQAGEVVPTKALENHLKLVDNYKSRLRGKSIDEHIQQLRLELKEVDTGAKGNKAKARIARKQKEIEDAINTAINMKYLDENLLEALSRNHQFIKKNPPQQVKNDYRDIEMDYIKLTMRDLLIQKIEALRELETEDKEDVRSDIDKDSRQINKIFKSMLSRSASIYKTEMTEGVKSNSLRSNLDSARIAYIWAYLNEENQYDSMSNWMQLIKVMSEQMDEGSVYRNIMQTADLLSQIGEMAQIGENNAEIKEEKDYYHELKKTASDARMLIMKKPIKI